MYKILLLSLVTIIPLALQAKVDVKKIQSSLKNSGASWTAKSTWISELPHADIVRLMGNKEEIKDNLDYSDVYSKSPTYETVDWRNMNGVNWLGPVLNQGNCGSCVAFAAIGTLEAQVSISTGAAWLKPQFSPQALFACGGGSCNQGWYPSSAASFIKSKGVVDNACAPYTMGSNGKDVACTQFCSNQSARVYKPAGTFNPAGWFGSAAKVKEALKKGPLMTSMTVYEDFLTYSSGIYKATTSRSVGGHAVSIVGYSDEGRYWIVRNSWGEDWGENGFVRVSWDDRSGIGSSAIGFEVNDDANSVAIQAPVENEYVSGEYQVKTQAERSENFTIKLMKNGQEVQALHSSVLNTNGLEDGKYELVAFSESNPAIQSLVRGFTISNTIPTMAIAFQGADGADLTKPLKGRLEFNVQVESSPIMMQKIDFMVTKLDGTPVTKRTTDVVMENMKLGFRFNSIPNGDYLIFFRGYLPAAGKMHTVDSAKIQIKNQNP